MSLVRRLPPGLRRSVRPLVRRARAAGRSLAAWLRPAVAWDGRHHPVFERFPRWTGTADGRFLHDFLGVRTDPEFRIQFRPDPPGPVAPGYPEPGPVYFETVFVLEAVLSAATRTRRPFTVVELGAGYGPWLVFAHAALQRVRPGATHLVGVEMLGEHVTRMRRHFADNGLDPSAHTILHGAIGDRDGTAFYVPDPDPGEAYGHAVARGAIDRAVEVPRIGMANLLEPLSHVDLMHVDVQGEEERILAASTALLGKRVARLLVATHDGGIHRRLRELMLGEGWRLTADHGVRSRERTSFGTVLFLDGMLGFVNPPLDDPSQSPLSRSLIARQGRR